MQLSKKFSGIIIILLMCISAWSSLHILKMNVHGSETPYIVSTSPEINELNVPVNTDIQVTFNVDMDESTMNETTFVVNARSTGRHYGTISYDNASDTAAFDPNIDFDVGEVVTVVLTENIRSQVGTPLQESYAWSFTTAVGGGGVGAGTFDAVSHYPVGGEGSYPLSVFAADVNDDSDIDIITASINVDISILLNDGCEGTLFDSVVYSTGRQTVCVFVADLDGDGDSDIVAGGERADRGLSVQFNHGDGTFGSPSYYNVGYVNSIFAADFDGDGDLDLAAAKASEDVTSVFFNLGNGTFTHASDYPLDAASIFAGDFDGDGALDLAGTYSVINSVSIYFNDGDGTFNASSHYPVGYGARDIFAADLNGDGRLDLATANDEDRKVSVILNQGNRTFGSPSHYNVGLAYSVFAADLDGDTDLDLATANYYDDTVSVLRNNGAGAFTDRSDYPLGDYTYPYSVFAADLDGDTDLDLAVADFWSENVSVLLNHGSPFFPSGNFKLGRAELRLRQHGLVPYVTTFPSADCKADVYDTDETGAVGYTNHSGYVTFQIPIECKDRSSLYNEGFYVWVEVREYEGGPLVVKKWWEWKSHAKWTKKDVLDVCTLHVEETRTYWVKVGAFVGYVFYTTPPYIRPRWWAEDNGTVQIVSRAHPPYQQIVKICTPHHMDTYIIGTDQLVKVRVQYYDSILDEYLPCTDTPVLITVVRDDGWFSETYNTTTDGWGEVNWIFNIPIEHLAEGTLTITAADLPKDTGFIDDSDLDSGDQVVIQAVYPDDGGAFGVFAVPHSSVLPGLSTNYTIGVVSIGFVGDVSLSVADLPVGTSGLIDPNIMSILIDETAVSNMTIFTEHYTPPGLHYFTIYVTNGTVTRNFTCPLMVSVPDVAVAGVMPSKTVVGQSCSLFISVTVENEGDFAETFNVTVYADAIGVATLSNETLTGGKSETYTFSWNTTGWAYGNYTISAYVWPVEGETDMDDNNLTDGWTIIAVIGDITGSDGWPDGKCDMRDVGLIASHFGENTPPAPANCDITGPVGGVPDGRIDMRDIGLIASHFGEVAP